MASYRISGDLISYYIKLLGDSDTITIQKLHSTYRKVSGDWNEVLTLKSEVIAKINQLSYVGDCDSKLENELNKLNEAIKNIYNDQQFIRLFELLYFILMSKRAEIENKKIVAPEENRYYRITDYLMTQHDDLITLRVLEDLATHEPKLHIKFNHANILQLAQNV